MKSIKRLLMGLLALMALTALLLPVTVFAQSSPPPGVTVTLIPRCGGASLLRGTVAGVTPADYRIAVYNYSSGWWTKPKAAQPLTTILPDGTWSTNVTRTKRDDTATQFAIFLVPNGYTPPLAAGAADLPADVYSNAVAYVIKHRQCGVRQLEFSGYTWQVKKASRLVGPGPNYFSNKASDIFVDEEGRLHLKVVKRDGKWYSTEVINTSVLGYGKYVFHVASRVDRLDPWVVLGLFTWDTAAPQYAYREIDIEFSRWGTPEDDNSQFVVQPYLNAGNYERFNTVLTSGQKSTHGFDWQPGSITFQSLLNDQSFPSSVDQIHTWTYTGADIPPTGDENVRINLWLIDGNAPMNRRSVEVIIDRFEFIPSP